MQKKFISNLVLMVFLNLLVKPFAIFKIDATVQDDVGAKAYGLYFSLLNLTFLFNILMDLGINNFTTKNISQYPHIVSRYMGKLFSFRLFLFGIYALITFGLGWVFGFQGYELVVLLFLIFNQFLATIIAYFRSHFAGFLLFKSDAIISVLDRVLLIVFCGIVLLSTTKNQFKIEWFVWIQTLCYGLTAIIAFVLLAKQIGIPKFSWHWSFSKAIVKKSIPYALLILLMMIYTRGDSVLLARFHPEGNYQAGIYAQGFRLLDAFFQFGMIFTGLLFPLFSRLIKNKESISSLLKTSSNLLIGGSVVLISFCYFNSEYIVSLIYENNIQESIPSFKWLMLSFIGMSSSFIFGTLLTANGNLRILNIYSFVTVVLNIGLNLILIPKYGAEGTAIVACITQCFIALIQFIYCAKEFQFQFSIIVISRYLFFVGSIIGILTITPFCHLGNIGLIIELILCSLAMFVFKMIDVKGMQVQFQKEM